MKKILSWGLLIFGGLILLLFLANLFVKNQLRQELDDQLKASAYEGLSVNIFSNTFSIQNVEMRRDRFALNADKIHAGGLSYFKYLFNDKVEFDELKFISPAFRLFPADTSVDNTKTKKSQRQVLFKSILVKDGSFSKKSNDSAKATFYTHIPMAQVRNVNTGMQLSNLQSYNVKLDNIYLKMNAEHYISVEELSAIDGKVDIVDFKIRSFLPREEFTREIPYEKDHITLDVNRISLDSLDVGMRNDSMYIRNSNMTVHKGILNIYRNKLLADDPNTIPLYSQLLRQAPILLNFQKVFVENSEIMYEERARAEGGPAVIRFAAVNGEINNLHNLRELSSQPKITANGDFMRGTPVNIEWTFPVFDPSDSFQISGRFGHLEGEALDAFLVPSLNIRMRGALDHAFFNFYGNDDGLQGDFRMEYEDFKIELLTKRKHNKKGFLSSLANLLVDNKQEPDEEESRDVQVERDKNRSFWNFIWQGLREGLIDSVGQL